MKPKISEFQERVLKALSGKIDDFYLAGGTALSLYYFQHRESVDLDFFTRRLDKMRVLEIINLLSHKLNKKIELIAQSQANKNMVRVMVYSMRIDKNHSLKMDFVEDYLGLIKTPKLINGIRVLSLEDINIRKIYALTGTLEKEDIIGRRITGGGREEAKDFYDLYCLSNIFMRLSDFSFRHSNQMTREALIRWFRTYSRFNIKTGLLELKLKKDVDYKDMERHFKREIDKILEKEVDEI